MVKFPFDIGDEFQIASGYFLDKEPAQGYSGDEFDMYKSYPDAEKKFPVDEPDFKVGKNLWVALRDRRSKRSYKDKPLEFKTLSQLIWASQGVTMKRAGYHLRTAPSAGGRFSVETYLVVRNVEDLPQGIYHFDLRENVLELIKEGDFSNEIYTAGLKQKFIKEAEVNFVWSSIMNRTKSRYGIRGYRYIYLDAGHIAQNLSLAAESLELGCCMVGSFYDDLMNELIEIDGKLEWIIYLGSIGFGK